MNRATPIATGTARTIAMTELSTVTQSRSAMPKRSVPPSTEKTREVKKFARLAARAGAARLTRKAPTSATSVMTKMPAPLAAPDSRRSPVRPVDRAGPGPAGRRLVAGPRALLDGVDDRRSGDGGHDGLLGTGEGVVHSAAPLPGPGLGRGRGSGAWGGAQLIASTAVATLLRTCSGSGA